MTVRPGAVATHHLIGRHLAVRFGFGCGFVVDVSYADLSWELDPVLQGSLARTGGGVLGPLVVGVRAIISGFLLSRRRGRHQG